ncbi:MAG: hypothetical protein KA955_09605 [Prevotella sp.]|nr:hypothetical protein [Prevotella sp.]
MKEIFPYILRLLASIIISVIVSFAISYITIYITMVVISLITVLIPEFISNVFCFSENDNVWLTMFIDTIITIIALAITGGIAYLLQKIVILALAITGGIVYLLQKIVNKSKVMMVIYGIIAIYFFIRMIMEIYLSGYYVEMGIDKSIWFYIVSIAMLAISFFVYVLIGWMLLVGDEINQ